MEKLIEEMDAWLQFPGMSNVWVQHDPQSHRHAGHRHQQSRRIRSRGPNPYAIEQLGPRSKKPSGRFRNRSHLFRASIGRPLHSGPSRSACSGALRTRHRRRSARRHGRDCGENITETIEGLARFPVNLRYRHELRDSVQDHRDLLIVAELADGDVGQRRGRRHLRWAADDQGENARPNGWIDVDIRGRDLGSYVHDAQRAVARVVELPAGIPSRGRVSSSISSVRRSGFESWCRPRWQSYSCCFS